MRADLHWMSAYLADRQAPVTQVVLIWTSLGLAAMAAAFTMLFAAGQTVGPWVAGILADHTSTEATLVWTAVLCAVAAMIAATVRRRHPAPPATARDSASPRRGA
ncbi:hypothetical protein [Streptosporangium canum]|nr:hypothetical protein [Streptosporangium canum]